MKKFYLLIFGLLVLSGFSLFTIFNQNIDSTIQEAFHYTASGPGYLLQQLDN
ncbi:MAG: hypothetical protein Q8P27_01595 [Candidatus Peregrinibacteria bacterium]|nr:hypothetical protein [Candidatus Peregrinibacteria bacterium]